jgi:hypothetical protein
VDWDFVGELGALVRDKNDAIEYELQGQLCRMQSTHLLFPNMSRYNKGCCPARNLVLVMKQSPELGIPG